MKLFLLPEISEEKDQEITLGGDDFHYLCHVKRLSTGDALRAKDRSSGKEYLLTLLEVSHNTCRFSIDKRIEIADSSRREIWLFQCLPKGKKMDLVTRQATEAGAKMIVPIESDHSLVKLATPKDREAKKVRWEKIIREALQQSGSPTLTEIEEPQPFNRLEKFTAQGGLGFFCHQEPLAEGKILPILKESPSEAPIGLVIGPEGGLSAKEVDNLKKWGYDSLYFGDNVLRTETASLYGISAINTILREFY